MTETRESPSRTGRRNPVDASAYHTDPRDKQREEREGLRRILFLSFVARDRDAVSQLERYMGALAEASPEKPRWQKIIEHANSLADELGTPREQFYLTAFLEGIGKIENERKKIENERKLLENLNDVYGGEMEQEEREFLQHGKDYHRRRLSTG